MSMIKQNVREMCQDGWCVRLDLEGQVLRLEVPEGVPHDPWLHPILPSYENKAVSAATLLVKAKQFDDGLYAAVDLAAQHGLGRFSGMAGLLRALAATLASGLPERSGGATTIHTACDLAGLSVPIPDSLRDSVQAEKERFLADVNSIPIGFYTWSPGLAALFRQDRFLQQPLWPETSDDLAAALQQTPGASTTYAAYRYLMTRLTNPEKPLTAWDAGKRPAFLPASQSHEVRLFETLYGTRPVPEGFDLLNELICRIRFGHIDLTPRPESGWYDHQTWSLEPLLVPDRMPEDAHLELGSRYRKHLEDLFRGSLALTRETHIRQLGGGGGYGGGPLQRPIVVRPELTVEPLPVLYSRRAGCYGFVRQVIEESFGKDSLRLLHRLTPDGSSKTNLDEELTRIENIFLGAAAMARRQLGMTPREADFQSLPFSNWRDRLGADADVSRDVRMMVPIFYDMQRRLTKVWAFLGWQTTDVSVTYRHPPTVLSVEPESGAEVGTPPRVEFGNDYHGFAVPVLAEVYVSRLLNRDEFRKHCDRFKTRAEILDTLP